MGTTIPGGRYRTADGRLVDANGAPLEEGGVASVAPPTPTVDVDAPVPKPKAARKPARRK